VRLLRVVQELCVLSRTVHCALCTVFCALSACSVQAPQCAFCALPKSCLCALCATPKGWPRCTGGPQEHESFLRNRRHEIGRLANTVSPQPQPQPPCPPAPLPLPLPLLQLHCSPTPTEAPVRARGAEKPPPMRPLAQCHLLFGCCWGARRKAALSVAGWRPLPGLFLSLLRGCSWLFARPVGRRLLLAGSRLAARCRRGLSAVA